MRTPIRQRGFAYVAAIVLLVVMAGMAAAVVRLNLVQQESTTAELQGVRAAYAARAGVEWGLYRARTNICRGTPATRGVRERVTLTDFAADSGFRVTVTIECFPFNEGEIAQGAAFETILPFQKIVYEISAVACNGAADCPADAATVQRADYVERRRTASACGTNIAARPDCYGDLSEDDPAAP